MPTNSAIPWKRISAEGIINVYDQLFPALAAHSNIQHIPLVQSADPDLVDPGRGTEIHVDLVLANLAAQRAYQIESIHAWLTAIRDCAALIMSEIEESLEDQ